MCPAGPGKSVPPSSSSVCRCPACFLTLPTGRLLEEHVGRVHTEARHFPCPALTCAQVQLRNGCKMKPI